MDTKPFLQAILIMIATASAAIAQSAIGQENPIDHLNRMSDAEAIGFVNSVLDLGLPVGGQAEGLYSLVISRSSLLLPLFEARIEQLLRSPFPEDLYTNKAASLESVFLFLTREIEMAGNQEALRQASKLLKIDEKRFGTMVERTMIAATAERRPFTTAYEGLQIGEPAVDKRIIVWVEKALADDKPSDGDMKHRWADAMAERYGAAPTDEQWAQDPIASRLKPGLARSLRGDVLRFAADASKRPERK